MRTKYVERVFQIKPKPWSDILGPGLNSFTNYFKVWRKTITTCDRCYEVWHGLQSVRRTYSKVWQVLQSAKELTHLHVKLKNNLTIPLLLGKHQTKEKIF